VLRRLHSSGRSVWFAWSAAHPPDGVVCFKIRRGGILIFCRGLQNVFKIKYIILNRISIKIISVIWRVLLTCTQIRENSTGSKIFVKIFKYKIVSIRTPIDISICDYHIMRTGSYVYLSESYLGGGGGWLEGL